MIRTISNLPTGVFYARFLFQHGDFDLSIEERLESVLKFLDSSDWPKPTDIKYSLKTKYRNLAISSFLSPEIAKILKRPDNIRNYEIYFNHLEYEVQNRLYLAFHLGIDRYSLIGSNIMAIRIPYDLCSHYGVVDIFRLLQNLLRLCPTTYFMNGCFTSATVQFWENRIDQGLVKDRTPTFKKLYWLQYFSATEIAIQGGIEAWESNPLLKCERIHDGLLVQVGDSPFDIFTPEGQDLLIKATDSLPPVNMDLFWKEEERIKPFLG